MRKLVHWIGSLLACWTVIAVWNSCTQEADCTGTNRPMLNAYFYTFVKDTVETGFVRDSLVRIAWDTLSVTAYATDSVIVNRDLNAASMTLPLRYAEPVTIFVLNYGYGYKDTITVAHENTPYFLNMDCGYQMKQEITQIGFTTHLLDSIRIKDPKIGIYGTENLALYY